MFSRAHATALKDAGRVVRDVLVLSDVRLSMSATMLLGSSLCCVLDLSAAVCSAWASPVATLSASMSR